MTKPAWEEVTTLAKAKKFAGRVGYPVLVRPSYVLSGTAMRVVYSEDQLVASLTESAAISNEGFLTSWLATEQAIIGKRLLLSLGGASKERLLKYVVELDRKGYELYATEGTHDFLAQKGIATMFVYKASDRRDPSVLSVIGNGKVNLVINIPSGAGQNIHTNGYRIRRFAINHHVPVFTNMHAAELFLQCLLTINPRALEPKSHSEFLNFFSRRRGALI